jgi:SHS2 domain-containing protein
MSHTVDCPGWEYFEHQSDAGIRGKGRSVQQAFEQIALALISLITPLEYIHCKTEKKLKAEADNMEMLLPEWLNSLIYEINTGKVIFNEFHIIIRNNKLKAVCCGEKLDIHKHHPAVEVKGVTYDQLSLLQSVNGLWIAQCVVDV